MHARRLALTLSLTCLALCPPPVAAAPSETLADAAKAGDAKRVARLAAALAEEGGVKHLRAILAQLKKTEDADVYWVLAKGAAAFEDEPSLDELGRQIVRVKKTPLAGDLLFALQQSATDLVVAPLAHVLEKGTEPLQLMAASQLAFRRTGAAVEALIRVWKQTKAEGALVRRIEGVFLTLTGQALTDAASAEAWWSEQGKTLTAHPKAKELPRDREFRTVERRAKDRIVVLSSDRSSCKTPHDRYDLDFDKIQKVLERRSIPHRVVLKHEFVKDPERYLKRCRALLINCSLLTPYCTCPSCQAGQVRTGQRARLSYACNPRCQIHINTTHRLGSTSLKAIKTWVERRGGYLYTEDWGMTETLALLWPKLVGSGKQSRGPDGALIDKPRLIRAVGRRNGRALAKFQVALRVGRGSASHPLMRGVWLDPNRTGTAARVRHTWQIDDESPAIEIRNRKKVVTLLESAWLEEHVDGHAAVAVTFRPGSQSRVSTGGKGEWALVRSGRVLHTLSHFGKQRDSGDGAALQNLLVNFLLEADRRHTVPRKR